MFPKWYFQEDLTWMVVSSSSLRVIELRSISISRGHSRLSTTEHLIIRIAVIHLCLRRRRIFSRGLCRWRFLLLHWLLLFRSKTKEKISVMLSKQLKEGGRSSRRRREEEEERRREKKGVEDLTLR